MSIPGIRDEDPIKAPLQARQTSIAITEDLTLLDSTRTKERALAPSIATDGTDRVTNDLTYSRPSLTRNSILGFLIGATAAGGAGYYYLLEEYQTASNLLLSSVEDLQASTNKVSFSLSYTYGTFNQRQTKYLQDHRVLTAISSHVANEPVK